jgi:crotonobetainyl-CoA:carnitine CoA-transferase CaiB-like acyl-CoA transferase
MLAGPYGGMLLADLGAEVVKIEAEGGDISRQVGTQTVGPHNVYFASLNRNKKSVQLDLRSRDGQQHLARLAAGSDALLVNMKPSTIKQLGLTYEALKAHNERLVCVALTGYGLEGADVERPAFDYVIQAVTGIASLTGEPDGPPTLVGYSVVDNSSGMAAALALLAMVVEGRGGQVDVSLHDVVLSQLNYKAAAYLNGGEAPARHAAGSHPFYVPAQLFETSDGHVALFVTHDEFWRRLASELGQASWVADPRFATMQQRSANRAELLAELQPLLREDTSEAWVARLRPLGIPVAAVSSLPTALAGDLTREREMVVDVPTPAGPIRSVGNPIKVAGVRTRYGAPPLLGEHNGELTSESPASGLPGSRPG